MPPISHSKRQQEGPNAATACPVFLIPCWSGEVISVAFPIDCHDREVPEFVAHRGR